MDDQPTNSAQSPHQMAFEQGTNLINALKKILGLNTVLQHLLRCHLICLYLCKFNNQGK